MRRELRAIPCLQLVLEVFAEMLWFWFNCFDGYLNPRWPTGWKQLAQAAHISVSPYSAVAEIGSEKGLFCRGSDGNQSKVVQIS